MEYLIKEIDKGATKCGDQKKLEAALDLAKGTITEVKGGRRGLPLEACYKLAEMTGANVVRLIAENAAITAKADKAEFWKKKLVELERIAAVILIGVISVVTPTPSEAAPLSQVADSTMYIMSNRVRRYKAKIASTFARIFDALPTIAARRSCCPD